MTDEIEARRAWAHALMRRSTRPVVRYGSPEWLALPEGPEKVAAVVVAAESWAREGDELVERLRLELEAAQEAAWRDHKAAEDAEFFGRRDAWRESWTGRGFRSDPAIAEDIGREWEAWVSGGDAA